MKGRGRDPSPPALNFRNVIHVILNVKLNMYFNCILFFLRENGGQGRAESSPKFAPVPPLLLPQRLKKYDLKSYKLEIFLPFFFSDPRRTSA